MEILSAIATAAIVYAFVGLIVGQLSQTRRRLDKLAKAPDTTRRTASQDGA
ncbi:hypothetical protein [Streptomyces sp. NRRL F-5135]|uniref:hypothetical protein n=1 Tax=Streptomyces sp. NRRL F-5135 TaxID=1463858 RepID=UPI00131C024E|nr:hypothetical protein [Streptomyces sp. NRRL F-5135]